MIAADPGTHRQALDDQQAPAVLAIGIIDHPRSVRSAAVGDQDPNRGSVPDDLHGEPAAPPTGGVPDRVGAQFGRDADHVVTCRALGQ